MDGMFSTDKLPGLESLGKKSNYLFFMDSDFEMAKTLAKHSAIHYLYIVIVSVLIFFFFFKVPCVTTKYDLYIFILEFNLLNRINS